MKGFADLADLPEDQRIQIIAQAAAEGNVVAAVVDDNIAADRYVQKLKAYPVRVIDRINGPVAGTVTIRVGPKES